MLRIINGNGHYFDKVFRLYNVLTCLLPLLVKLSRSGFLPSVLTEAAYANHIVNSCYL